MATINGSSFLIYKNDDPIGHSNNAIVNLNCDLPDSSTKDSNGWKEVLAGVRSGTIEVTGLTDYSDTVNFEELAEMVLLGTSTTFYFSQDVEGYGDGLVLYGTGYIQSVDEEASVEAITNYNLTINLTTLILIDERTGEVWDTDFDEWETAISNWEVA
jgi:predicted secreted protein|tara:strand:+ start:390 stop:863 length:474 start_codon:yes stop_codon:yes gene_type:complete